MSKYTTPMFLYVTRKTADGLTASLSVPAWLFLTLGALVVLNVFVWSAICLYEAVKFIA